MATTVPPQPTTQNSVTLINCHRRHKIELSFGNKDAKKEPGKIISKLYRLSYVWMEDVVIEACTSDFI
jgi:hypothetical protein